MFTFTETHVFYSNTVPIKIELKKLKDSYTLTEYKLLNPVSYCFQCKKCNLYINPSGKKNLINICKINSIIIHNLKLLLKNQLFFKDIIFTNCFMINTFYKIKDKQKNFLNQEIDRNYYKKYNKIIFYKRYKIY
jgi:hypothetical protein